MSAISGLPVVPGPSAPVPLLERELEMAALHDAAAAAAAGQARLVVVEGPAGIGKSRLLGELRARAPALGLRPLAARGSELEREFPFGVVRQLFEPALMADGARDRWLAGPAAPAASVFAPPAEDMGADDASFAALHGLFWLTATAAGEHPLLLAVDDLHWADRPSLRYLSYLAHRLEGLAVLLVVGLRSGEPGADPALVGEIAQDPAALPVRPAPLSDGAAGELVAARLGEPPDPAFRAACHEATGGNPLLLGQLLRSLGDDAVRPDAPSARLVHQIGPQAIARTILSRVARLPEDALPVARAVAVLGDSADLRSVAALADVDEARAAAATDALARAEILGAERPLGFVHPLVREAVYRDMSVARREVQHEAAAAMLSIAGAPAERVAAHLLQVSPRGDPGVVATLRAAAAAAAARGAPESATALLRRALDEPPAAADRASVLTELGMVESQVEAATGTARLREAYAALDDPLARLRVARPLAWGLIFTGDAQGAADLAREAAATAPAELDDLRRWLTAIELVAINFDARVPDGLARLAAERGGSGPDGPGARALRCIAAFDWAVRGGGRDEAGAMAAAALEGGDLLDAPDGHLLAVTALVTLEMGERPEADAAWDAALAAAHRNGSLFAISAIRMWRGDGLARRGDLAGGGALMEEARTMMGRWGIVSQSYPVAFLAEQRIAAGDVAGARALMPFTTAWGPHSDARVLVLRAEAEVALAEGRHEDALGAAETIADVLQARGMREETNPAWLAWRSLQARALVGIGRRDEALALLQDELARARSWGAPGPVGRSLRLIGEIAPDDRLRRLEEAVAVLEGSTARLELARALASLGGALRRARRPTDAREPLRRALEIAATCGAEALVAHVRAELHAAGARPRSTALRGAAALTPSERRVADLAARGASNRDIAEALYVTPKTIELHLSSAYRKLGVRSRHDLAAALGDP